MAWWLCFALWLSTLLVSVLGPAFVQWGLTCEVVRGDRIGLQSATNFDSFGTRRPANLRHGARVWRPGRAAGRQRESCGKPWRPKEWSAAGGWTLRGHMKGPSAHALPSASRTVSRVCVRCVYTSCGCPQVKSRAGHSSLCTLNTQPWSQCIVVTATWCSTNVLNLFSISIGAAKAPFSLLPLTP